MAIKGFRLGSIVPHGVGGPEAGAIEYIYAVLLHQMGQDHYSVSVNQVGSDLNEFISKGPGKRVHINTQFPVVDNFNHTDEKEKNLIRLEVIHDSMLRIAEVHHEYDVSKLKEIKQIIIERDFSFEIPVKHFRHPKNKDLIAKIIVKPKMFSFEYFAIIEIKGAEVSRVPFYNGITTFFYLTKFFQKAKWKGENKIILTGQDNIVETHIYFDEGKVEYINLTQYLKPPYFELMKAEKSEADKEKYSKDWKHSLQPHIAAILNYEAN
jgi:hypothetical protein